jgi:hypothetical protein
MSDPRFDDIRATSVGLAAAPHHPPMRSPQLLPILPTLRPPRPTALNAAERIRSSKARPLSVVAQHVEAAFVVDHPGLQIPGRVEPNDVAPHVGIDG